MIVYVVIERNRTTRHETITGIFSTRKLAVENQKRERAADTFKAHTYVIYTYTVDAPA